MSGKDKDLEILNEIAKSINVEENPEMPATEGEGEQQKSLDKNSQIDDSKKSDKEKHNKPKGNFPLTSKQLLIKKGNQNLAERKVLLIILAVLLGIQLFFMNAVVLLIILYSIFDWDVFRTLDATVLHSILDFTKYYVTAVLVELLGGIIYIVHRVFTNKD